MARWAIILWGWLIGLLAAGYGVPPCQAQPIVFDRAQALAVAGLNEGFAFASAMTVDGQGNTYVTGHFGGTQHFGATSLNAGNDFDMYVAKVDTSGRVLWAVQGGSPSNDYSPAIALDRQGNVYVAGSYLGPTATYGATTLSNSGTGGFFVAKLTPDGRWQWAIGEQGGDNIEFTSLAVSSQGVVWLAGSFGLARPRAALGPYAITSQGTEDVLVAQLSTTGRWLGVVTAGGTSPEQATRIALDAQDNAYVTGRFTSSSATFGSHTLRHSLTSSAYNPDLFVAKLAPTGAWQWATGGGGAGLDAGYGIALSRHNRVYVTGTFQQAATWGAARLTSTGDSDVLVACLTAAGEWEWAVGGGSPGADYGISIAATTAGSVYVGGSFGSTGGAPTLTARFGAFDLRSAGTNDAFIARLDTAGAYRGAVAAGGLLEDNCSSVAVVGERVYLAGSLSSSLNVSPAAQFGSVTIVGNPTTFGRMYTPWLARLAVPALLVSAPGSDPLVQWDARLNLPNIITPNGDALNDTFAPANLPTGPWEFTVFSRWGQQVYQSTDYRSDWGKAASGGIYYYLLRHLPTGRMYKAWLEVVP